MVYEALREIRGRGLEGIRSMSEILQELSKTGKGYTLTSEEARKLRLELANQTSSEEDENRKRQRCFNPALIYVD